MSIRKNTVYNIGGAVVPLLATLFTLPIYLSVIGEARFGVLIILWMLLGYFGLFDLGLGRAVTNRIAAMWAASAADREAVFWTAIVMSLAVGVPGAAVLWGAGELVFRHAVPMPEGMLGEVSRSLPLMAAAFPVILTSSVMYGALMGREHFLAKNAVRSLEGVFIQVMPLLAAIVLGPELPVLVAAIVGIRLVATGGLLALCVRMLPTGLLPRAGKAHVWPLFAYGGWVTVTSAVGPLLSTLDRVIIGALAGVRAVTYYSVPLTLVSRVSVLPGSLANALFPRFSAFEEARQRGELQQKAVLALAVVLTPLVVLLILGIRPFLAWWVSPEFAASAGLVGEIVALGIWTNCLAYVPYAMLQGAGRPDVVAKIHLIEIVPYLVFLWWALGQWGVAGAAAAWSLRVAADAALLFMASRVRKRLIIRLTIPAALLVAASVLVWYFEPSLVLRLLAALALVLLAVWWGRVMAPAEMRAAVSRLLARGKRQAFGEAV